MKRFTLPSDKLAIGLSSLCVLHCLAFPVLAVMLPSFAALGLNTEAFHLWMIVAVIPTSIYALTMGCKKHGNITVFSAGLLGLGFLLAAFVFGESYLNEVGEKLLTVVGATIIALAHFKNFKLCQQSNDNCACPND